MSEVLHSPRIPRQNPKKHCIYFVCKDENEGKQPKCDWTSAICVKQQIYFFQMKYDRYIPSEVW